MQLELRSPAKKRAALAAVLVVSAVYIGLAATQFLSAYFSTASDAISLKRAVRLDPGNAEARYRLGKFELLASQSPQSALPWLESAARLDHHAGRYWTDLAIVQASLGESDS